MKAIATFLGGAATWAIGHLGVLTAVAPHIVTPAVSGIIAAVGAVVGIVGGRAAVAPANAAATAALLDILPKGIKTVLGAVLALITYALSPDVVGVLSPKLASVLMTISALLVALGITHAAAVNAVKVG